MITQNWSTTCYLSRPLVSKSQAFFAQVESETINRFLLGSFLRSATYLFGVANSWMVGERTVQQFFDEEFGGYFHLGTLPFLNMDHDNI